MKRLIRVGFLGAALLAALVTALVGSAQAETIVFTAQLLPSSEVPPGSVSPPETGAFGTVIVTLAVTRGVTNGILSTVAQIEFLVSGLPSSSTITQGQVHQGGSGVNGPVKIDAGVPSGGVQPVGGIARFLGTNLFVATPDTTEMIANPGNFYFNVHTALSPGGALRGQLQPPPPLQFADPVPGVTAQLFTNQVSYAQGDRFQVTLIVGNSIATQSDVFVGLALSAAETAILCPLTPGDQALRFRGPLTTSDECRSNLTRPGNRAVPLISNRTLPVADLQLFTLVDETVTLSPGLRFFFLCAAPPGSVQSGVPLARCVVTTYQVR